MIDSSEKNDGVICRCFNTLPRFSTVKFEERTQKGVDWPGAVSPLDLPECQVAGGTLLADGWPSDRRASPGGSIEPAWIALTLAPRRALRVLSKNYIEAYRLCKLEALV